MISTMAGDRATESDLGNRVGRIKGLLDLFSLAMARITRLHGRRMFVEVYSNCAIL